jgi:hypothetical protein
VEGNCVVEGRGGEQPEANDQSINKTMLNSIRPEALASLQIDGEAQNGIRPGKGERKIRDLTAGESSEQRDRNAWGDWRSEWSEVGAGRIRDHKPGRSGVHGCWLGPKNRARKVTEPS